MSRPVAFPFLTLPKDCVETSPWFAKLGSEDLTPLSTFIEKWDYCSSLHFQRKIGVNWDAAATNLGFDSDFELGVAVRVGTGQGTLARMQILRETSTLSSQKTEHLFNIDLRGEILSDQIVIESSILLFKPASDRNRLSPDIAGARLWTDTQAAQIEGAKSRFPMEIVNFDAIFPSRPEADALWYLHWQTDGFDRDLRGAIRLYLNANRPEFIERVQVQDEVALQMLFSDVINQLCERYLISLGDRELPEHDIGTVGRQIGQWLRLAFGSVSGSQMKSKLDYQPAEFRATLQAVARI